MAEKNKAFFAADKHKLRLCERRPKVLMRGTERRVMNLSFFDFWKMGFVDLWARDFEITEFVNSIADLIILTQIKILFNRRRRRYYF